MKKQIVELKTIDYREELLNCINELNFDEKEETIEIINDAKSILWWVYDDFFDYIHFIYVEKWSGGSADLVLDYKIHIETGY